MKYCALCCIVKDEDPFLKEWLAYHALLGFERFFIYDNLSATPVATLLEGWAGPETLTVIRNSRQLSQPPVYDHCLQNFGDQCKWIAFLDLDEFIRLKPNPGTRPDIRVFLAEFEPYAGLGLNWRMFSSAGLEKSPRAPVTAAYRQCLGDDLHIKSVVQPARVRGASGPHAFYPRQGETLVNARHFPIPGGFPFSPPATERIAVNHYFYKSRQCFAAKIAKGNPCNIQRRMEEFEQHLALPAHEDDYLLSFIPDLRAALRAPVLAAPPLPEHQSPLEEAHALIAAAAPGEDLTPALLLLCAASMLNDSGAFEGQDPAVVALRIWTLRATAARKSRDFGLAEHCLAQAMKCDAERGAYAEWAALLAESGRMSEAGAALEIIARFENLHGSGKRQQ